MPEVLFKADHEGTWIITAMNRTGAKKLIVSFFEVCAQALGVQDRLNGNGTFEIWKTQKVGAHC
jgi:hypothetical protein